MLMIGGELRPMLHAAVATEIMFYHERFLAKEMHSVLTCMREAYSAIGAPGEDAHAKMIEWGVAIRVKFDVDNLHLTEKQSHAGHEKVVHAVKQLGSSHASQGAQLADVAARQIRLESKLDTIIDLLSRVALPLPTSSISTSAHTVPPPSPSAAATAATVASIASIAAASPTPPTTTNTAINNTAPPSSNFLSPSSLLPVDLPYKMTKLLSGQFFLDCMGLYGGELPPAVSSDSRRRAPTQKVLDVYKAMSTVEERTVLLDPYRDSEHAREIVKGLTKLIVKRILIAYRFYSVSPPPGFETGSIYVNTLIDNLRDSKLSVEMASLSAWRAQPVSLHSSLPLLRASVFSSQLSLPSVGSPSGGLLPSGGVLGKRAVTTAAMVESGSEGESEESQSGLSPDKAMKL